MAFQNLRTGSTVYIFHKDNSPKLEIGQVIAEPKIRQKYPIPTEAMLNEYGLFYLKNFNNMATRKRLPLDMYDDIPMEMRKYLRFHGWHFNKKACDFAVSLMRKKNASTGKTEKIEPLTKDQVDSMLAKYGVTLENNVDYDYVYVANMGKADLLKSSITDEQHLALYVKDVVDDVDAGDGEIMREWDAKMTSRGIAVDWEEIL